MTQVSVVLVQECRPPSQGGSTSVDGETDSQDGVRSSSQHRMGGMLPAMTLKGRSPRKHRAVGWVLGKLQRLRLEGCCVVQLVSSMSFV